MLPTNTPSVTEPQRELLKALAAYCECSTDELGTLIGTCPGHATLATDPIWLQRLCFVRELVVQLQVEELSYGKPVRTAA